MVWFCDLFFLFYFLVLLAEGGKYDLICYFDMQMLKNVMSVLAGTSSCVLSGMSWQ